MMAPACRAARCWLPAALRWPCWRCRYRRAGPRRTNCWPSAAPIDEIRIVKGARTMDLVRDGEVVGSYRIALGFAPEGDKERRGDGRTPEGRYTIIALNRYSQFHLSLRLDYPNAEDRARAAAAGVDPGSDIMIHGLAAEKPPSRAAGQLQGLDRGLRRRLQRGDRGDRRDDPDRHAGGDHAVTPDAASFLFRKFSRPRSSPRRRAPQWTVRDAPGSRLPGRGPPARA